MPSIHPSCCICRIFKQDLNLQTSSTYFSCKSLSIDSIVQDVAGALLTLFTDVLQYALLKCTLPFSQGKISTNGAHLDLFESCPRESNWFKHYGTQFRFTKRFEKRICSILQPFHTVQYGHNLFIQISSTTSTSLSYASKPADGNTALIWPGFGSKNIQKHFT